MGKEELKCLQTGRNRANELLVVFARTQDYSQPGWCKEQRVRQRERNKGGGKEKERERASKKERR